MSKINNILKYLFIILLSLFLAVGAILQTTWVRNYVKERLIEKIEKDTNYHVSIDELKLYPSFQLTATNVILSDHHGKRIDCGHLFVGLYPLALWDHYLHLSNLNLEELKIHTRKSSDEGTVADTIKQLPIKLKIDTFGIKGLSILEPEKTSQSSYTVSQGFLYLDPNQKLLYAKGKIAAKEQPEQWVSGELSYDQGHGTLQFNTVDQINFNGEYFVTDEELIHVSRFHASNGPVSIEGNIIFDFGGKIADSSVSIESRNLSEKYPVEGKFSGEGNILGSAWAPEIDLKISSDQLTFRGHAFGKIEAKILSVRAKNGLEGDISLSFTKDGEPYQFSGTILWDETLGPLPTRVLAKTSLAEIVEVMAFDSSNVSGDVMLALEITDEKVKGRAVLENGRVESYTLGSIFSNVHAEVEGDLEQITLIDFNAEDGAKGTYTGNGTIQFEKESTPIMNLEFTMVNAALIQLDTFKTTGTGNITITGPLNKPTISGTLTTESARYDIPDTTSEANNTIDVTYINQLTGETPPTLYKKKEPGPPINLNIQIEIPDNLKIKGKEFSSTWEGKGVISGTTNAFLINGKLNVTKGKYLIRGKPINFHEGTLTFAGDLEKKTSIYLIGSVNIDKYAIEMIIKGPVSDPSVSFRSNPPLPQREILSWILFNKGTSEISQFQGTQLNQSIRSLGAGASQGPDVLTRIGNMIGIDRIDITPSAEDASDVTVEIGKYLTETTYVSISQSLSGDTERETDCKRIRLQTDLGKNFKLEAEIDDDQNGQLNLLWKKDY